MCVCWVQILLLLGRCQEISEDLRGSQELSGNLRGTQEIFGDLRRSQ